MSTAADLVSLELSARERRFLRTIIMMTLQDLAAQLRHINSAQAPTMHRDAQENLELAAGLLTRLPRDETAKPEGRK